MKLVKLANNLHKLEMHDAAVYFSYETPIAMYNEKLGFVVSKNKWGATTGKHLNIIDGGLKEERVDHHILLTYLDWELNEE